MSFSADERRSFAALGPSFEVLSVEGELAKARIETMLEELSAYELGWLAAFINDTFGLDHTSGD